ncbi:MAG: pentapeptide repeat-containing protein [Crocosphaera sp.]
MKAKELLAKYRTGERNFRGVNLSGESLQEQDLSGSDFTEANLQGANFTNTNLENTLFTGAKLGLQKRSAFSLVIGLYVISAIASIGTAVFAWFSYGYFVDNETTKFVGGIGFIIIAIIWLVVAFSRNLISAMVSGIIAGGILGGYVGSFDGSGVFFGTLIVAMLTLATETLTLVSVLAIVSAIAIIGEIGGFIGVILSLILAIPAAWATYAFSGNILAIIGPGAFFLTLVTMGTLSLWRTLKGDKRDAWIRPIIIFISSIKGTNFYNANLANTNLANTNLKGIDLRRAILTRTCWQQTKNVDFARLDNNSLLLDLAIRNLLVTGQGKNQSFKNKDLSGANLTGASLEYANLINTNLRDADLTFANLENSNLKLANLNKAKLEDANLSNANLTGVQAIEADLTNAHLTGACVDSWNINSKTILKGIDCKWIYLADEQESPTNNNYSECYPSKGEFPPGGFAKLFKEISETVELITWVGVDWKDFLKTPNEKEVEAISNLRQTPTNLVLLTLKGDLEQGFAYVAAQIWVQNQPSPYPIQIPGGLKPQKELITFYKNWKKKYTPLCNLLTNRSTNPGSFDRGTPTNVSVTSAKDEIRNFKRQLNQWLEEDAFQNIRNNLLDRFGVSEQVKVIIVSEDEWVRKIPWHLFSVFQSYDSCEVGLSLPFYDRPEHLSQRTEKRVLIILGDSTGINVKADQEVLERYWTNPDNITIVSEPSREELYSLLSDPKGWDILCFSGHSYTQNNQNNEDGKQSHTLTGRILINSQDNGEIEIQLLVPYIRQMIQRGLELAIFNSCDGLGIALQLQKIHIPQLIIMRESIPDQVAQYFFKSFIIE